MKLKRLKLFLRSWAQAKHQSVSSLSALIAQLRDLHKLVCCQLTNEQCSSRHMPPEQIETMTAQEHIFWRQRCKLKWLC